MVRTTALGQPIRLDTRGQMVIPARMIEALGVEPGDTLAAWIEGDQLIIRARQSVEKDPWAMFAGIERSLADELIAERRADAKRELE